jgi:putative ABC transport system permease protein
MIKNNFKIAFRGLLKNKLFTFIKLVGLTIGLTACLLIWLYTQHEISYDQFHVNADRIARVTMEYSSGGEVTKNIEVTGNKVAPSFQQDFPEVESAVRVIKYQSVVKNGSLLFEEKNFYYADSAFFDIFTFPLLEGDPKTALNAPLKLVITSKMAEKYFGNANPIGKELKVGSTKEYVVSGVMEPAPANSKLQPDFIASFTSLSASRAERSTWCNANYATFLLLYPQTDLQAFNDKIPSYMAAHAEETGSDNTDENYLTFFAESLLTIHLKSETPGNFVPNGDKRYIYILGMIAFLILLIGSTTYVNLTTAQSTERAKEIGVHKVLGVSPMQLFGQHISEAMTITGLALFTSFCLTALSLPLFNQLIGRSLTWAPLLNPLTLQAILIFGIFVSFLTGAYPALVVSRFKPAEVLKGSLRSSTKGAWLHKSLIVLQFGISALLIICTVVLNGQLGFIQNKKLGYEKNHVIALPTDQQIVKKLDAFKSEFSQNKHVLATSLVYETPVHIQGGYEINKSFEEGNGKPVAAIPVDEDFVKALSIELVAGSDFSRQDVETVRRMDEGKDSTSALQILINEAQCAAFGWTPEEAINQYVNFKQRAQIKGVVKNFHFASLHEQIKNLVIFPTTWGQNILVKLDGKDIASSISFLEKKWTKLVPHRPFSYHFMDEEFEQMYGSEKQTAKMVTAFSILAILLACLGLFGIATYTITQRAKEIGIRKVLGASVSNIVLMLSKNFLLLVLIGLIIAAPLSWYLMNNWLQDFTYRIDIKWWMFALPGILAISVAFVTISLQSLRVALANPVESIRTE